MTKRTMLMLILLISCILIVATVFIWLKLANFFGTTSQIIRVPQNYSTIQEAIDAANPGDTILVAPAIYHEHLTINKNNLTLCGQNHRTILDGKGDNENLVTITANYTKVSGFTIKNGGVGIWLEKTVGSTISNNNITNNELFGIYLYESCNNIIIGNNIANTNYYGIWLRHSSNNIITENNLVENNRWATCLYQSHNNTLTGNNILNNHYGVWLKYSSNNTIYHNNFINNSYQADLHESFGNAWENAYPSGGNYWSDHNGTDIDQDGIADTPYTIDDDNQDNYPLMGMFSKFTITLNGKQYPLTTVCNSTISNFQFNETEKTISFNVAGPYDTLGFCRLTIHNTNVKDLWGYNYTVLVDGKPPIVWQHWTDETYTYICFTYQHPEHKIKIKPTSNPPNHVPAVYLWY